MKKTLSIVLVLLFTLTLLPQAAFAASGATGKVYYHGYDTGVTYTLIDGHAVVDAIPMLTALGCVAQKYMGESGTDPIITIHKDGTYIGNLEVSLGRTSGIVFLTSTNQTITMYMVNTDGSMLCGLSGITWLLNMQYQPGPDTELCIGDVGQPVQMPKDASFEMPAQAPVPNPSPSSIPAPVPNPAPSSIPAPGSGQFTIITPALTEGLQITGVPSSMTVGESASLTVTENGVTAKVSKWKPSSSSLASISSKGVLKAKKAGTVKVTATLKDKRTVTITLTIAAKPKTTAKGSWKAGTKSVYGAKLTQSELNAVKAVCEQAAAQISPNMNDIQKLNALASFLTKRTVYEDWEKNKYNNTAYGPLINGKGACSGYARAFKALCDVAGIGCYYIHTSDTDSGHQWNMVKINGYWMHVDMQQSDDQAGRGPGGCGPVCGSPMGIMSYKEKDYPKTKYGLAYRFTDGTLPQDWRDSLVKTHDINRPVYYEVSASGKPIYYDVGTEPK